jgi:hypothetical protein
MDRIVLVSLLAIASGCGVAPAAEGAATDEHADSLRPRRPALPEVCYLNPNGCTPDTLVGDLEGPNAVAADGDFVYFGTDTDQTLRRIPVNVQQTPQTLVTSAGYIMRIVVDDANLFFTAVGGTLGGGLFTIPKSGGSPRLLFNDGHQMQGLVMVGNSLYVTTSLEGAIYRVGKQGGVTQIAGSGDALMGLATDGANLYATAPYAGKVVSVPLQGGALRPLAIGLATPWAIAVSGGTVYFANITDGQILSVPTTGGTVSWFYQGIQGSQKSIIISLGRLYYTEYGDQRGIGGTVVGKALTGGGPFTYSTGPSGSTAGIAAGNNMLYWAERGPKSDGRIMREPQ